MPKPSSLTPQLQASVVKLISGGYYELHAAALTEIPRSTYLYWKERGERDSDAGGRRGRSRYARFYREIEKAIAYAEAVGVDALRGMMVGQVQKSSDCPGCGRKVVVTVPVPQSLKAVTFWLERKAPDRWGRRIAIELESKIGRSELETLLQRLAAAIDTTVKRNLPDKDARALLGEIGGTWMAVLDEIYPGLVDASAEGGRRGAGNAELEPQRAIGSG